MNRLIFFALAAFGYTLPADAVNLSLADDTYTHVRFESVRRSWVRLKRAGNVIFTWLILPILFTTSAFSSQLPTYAIDSGNIHWRSNFGSFGDSFFLGGPLLSITGESGPNPSGPPVFSVGVPFIIQLFIATGDEGDNFGSGNADGSVYPSLNFTGPAGLFSAQTEITTDDQRFLTVAAFLSGTLNACSTAPDCTDTSPFTGTNVFNANLAVPGTLVVTLQPINAGFVVPVALDFTSIPEPSTSSTFLIVGLAFGYAWLRKILTWERRPKWN